MNLLSLKVNAGKDQWTIRSRKLDSLENETIAILTDQTCLISCTDGVEFEIFCKMSACIDCKCQDQINGQRYFIMLKMKVNQAFHRMKIYNLYGFVRCTLCICAERINVILSPCIQRILNEFCCYERSYGHLDI